MLSPSLVLLSDQTALERSMDIVANNVANTSTTGFKRMGIEFDTLLSQPAPGKSLNFVVDRATYRDSSTGPITPTGNTLDMAIQGNGYFEVQMPDGTMRYTRNGAFQRNSQGQISTLAGQPVLSDGGQAITIPDTVSQINVASDGSVSARIDNGTNLAQLGKIGIFTFAHDQTLQAQGNGLYTAAEPAQLAPSSSVIDGSIEQSNVQPVTEMTQMIRIMRSYEQTSNLISQENQRLTQAMNVLSRTTT
ncbi:MAG: flagellar basal-body rod protein FlgF [Pseudomonadota bacterium]|nr:flagellar basal-body rod protein FlgF [Pseudomonadota bacterium]